MLLPTRISIGILILGLFGSVLETHAAPLYEGTVRAAEESIRDPSHIFGGVQPSRRVMREHARDRERMFFQERLDGQESTRLTERQLRRVLLRY